MNSLKDKIFTPAEWHKVIVEWNSTESPFPKDKTITELFAETVKAYPDSVALAFKDKKLTYIKLQELSSNFARYLATYTTLAKRKIIAIYMERSLESFVAILGILKAGSAYLAIHLHAPTERIQTILDDAEVDIIITQERLMPKLNNIERASINIITVESILTNHHTGPENTNKTYSHDLAYVIYTSGTTGKPKGIQICHQGVSNLITHVKRDYGVTHKTKVLQFASLSFDASVYEWAGALLNGAELHILAEDELPPKSDLAASLREKKINFTLLPPPVLESIDNSNLNDLHTLISGGEACTKNIVKRWAKGRRLFNAYGPSEATVACCFSRCYPQRKITIGRPIQNVKLYVLDEEKKPVPIGTPGELYIGGVGLAKGYLNQEDLTKKAFGNNPFLTGEGRLYRTGDLVRWLENGELEYIERVDTQIKLEGYRIELSEIESHLNNFPEIEQSYVIAHKIDETHKQLIAFYILRNGISELNQTSFNEYIRSKIPKYMIPASFIPVAQFPLTLSNKIDHKALIEIYEKSKTNLLHLTHSQELIPLLQQTWKELLNCENVAGNFFSLGGDSIRAIQFVAIMRKHGYHMSSKTLYENPTINELADYIKENFKISKKIIQKDSIAQGKVPLSPIQHWFFEQKFDKYNQWNQAFLFLTKININPVIFEKAWRCLIKYHDTLRLRFKIDSDKITQYYENNDLAYSFILKEFNLSENSNGEKDWITKKCIKLQNSLNIEKGPVIAVGLFNNHPDGNQRILIAIHHLLVDGISWRILLEDLLTAYDQLINSQQVTYTSKSDHYSTWVKALIEYAKKEETLKQKSYWQKIPRGFEENSDQNLKKYLIKDQEHYLLTFNKDTTLGFLHELPRNYPIYINDILLTGLSFALYKEYNNNYFLIEMEGHGREECIAEVEVNRTIGWFTSIFPVRLQIPSSFHESNASNWASLLLSIKKELRQIPDKGIGYGVLKYLTDANALAEFSHLSVSILFNYLGQFDFLPKNSQWMFATESPGNPIGTDYFGIENCSRYPLEINGIVVHDSLHINFSYNKHIFSKEKIQSLANNYKLALEKLLVLGKESVLENLYLPEDFSTENNGKSYKAFSLINIKDYQYLVHSIDSIKDIYPASYLQSRILSHPNQERYADFHIVSNYSVRAKFNHNKLVKIFNDLVNKHELLRSAFIRNSEGAWTVIVYQTIDLNLEIYSNQNSDALAENEKLKPFDFSKPGLFKIIINDFGEYFDLILAFYFAIEDGWSMASLVNEFGDAYLKGKPVDLKLSVQYGEYIQNELNAIKNQVNITFWKEYLKDVKPTKIKCESDKVKSKDGLYNLFFLLSPEQVKLIHVLSKELRISLDSVFLLTYLKTLRNIIQNSDLCIGVVANNRLEKEDGDKLFGMFLNIIPFRFKLDELESDLDKLLGVFNNKVNLQKYKQLPYEYIKKLFSFELYEFVFDFVHLHLLNQRPRGIESISGYERTHIPFILTVAQKGEQAIALNVMAHADFINKQFLDDFVSSYKEFLALTIDAIKNEINIKKLKKIR